MGMQFKKGKKQRNSICNSSHSKSYNCCSSYLGYIDVPQLTQSLVEEQKRSAINFPGLLR